MDGKPFHTIRTIGPCTTTTHRARASTQGNGSSLLHPFQICSRNGMYATAGDGYATPAVVDDTVYAGDTSGTVYALTRKGQLIWKSTVNGPITASALVTDRMVILGDQLGYVYGLDRWSGRVIGSIHPNPNQYAAIFGSPVWVGDGDAVLGVSSNEDLYGSQNPNYSCCHFRGQVLRFHADDGQIVWQTYLISAEDSANGIAGSSVWASPTYDQDLRMIYIATGNCYPGPGCSDTSDSIIGLNAETGAIVWKHQFVANDIESPEADFGDSPQVYLANGRKVVGAGEKYTGVYSVLDARTGELVQQQQVVPSCPNSNGLFSDSAVAGNMVFVNGENCQISNGNPLLPTGAVAALTADASKILWQQTFAEGPVFSGLAVANGVVYFQVSDIPGSIYAVDSKNGNILANLQVSGGINYPEFFVFSPARTTPPRISNGKRLRSPHRTLSSPNAPPPAPTAPPSPARATRHLPNPVHSSPKNPSLF